MGDRVRIGELLAAVGTVGLAIVASLSEWFHGYVHATIGIGGTRAHGEGNLSLDAGTMGWFAFAVLVIALLAGIVYILRVLTGRGPERAMLQAPVAFAFSLFAFFVLLVRIVLFTPGIDHATQVGSMPRGATLISSTTNTDISYGAWIGLACVAAMVIGTWVSMADERTGSKAAKKRTAELLADVPVRRVPHVPATPDPDSDVVADDAVGTDPTTPPSAASGGPA
jgi:hypothetical protein